jgi:tetratricopeptide (TPR) repeat protein
MSKCYTQRMNFTAASRTAFGVSLILVAVLGCGVLPACGQDGSKRFQKDSGDVVGGQSQVQDIPGLIGLAAVAEQYDDTNKAAGYYSQALGILNSVNRIEGERLIFTLKRFDKLLEDTNIPEALALHGRLQQLMAMPAKVARARLTIGPETDTVGHEEPTSSMIAQAQQMFQQRNLLGAEEQLTKAIDFESALRHQVKSGQNEAFHQCLRADTAYKLGVVYYYQGKYDLALDQFATVLDVYDQVYGRNSQQSERAQFAIKETQDMVASRQGYQPDTLR